MNNILITSAGQRVSLVKAFKNELSKLFPESKVYTVDANPILAPACHVSDGFRTVGKVVESNYIDELIKICLEWEIKLIIPTIDTELSFLAEHRDTFEKYNIIPIVSDLSFVKKCRDKRIINEFFKLNGIEIPKEINKKNPTFPLFLKPYDGSLSKDIYLIKMQSELTASQLNNPKLMYMEYIDPKEHDEYTVDAYYDKNGILKCAVPRKRIFVRSGEINKGVTNKNELVNYLRDKLSYIEGAKGCLTLQFFFNQSTKRIVGIEINPRFGGGYPLSYLAGANFPKWIIDEFLLEKDIPYFDEWENNLLMLRYDDEILIRDYEG